jgi:hypothetical protein
MRFDYLTPAQGAVVEGLEDREKIFALEQPEYLPIRTLAGEKGQSSIYRCELTKEQRQMVAEGADVLVEILHFGGPLAPSRVMLLNQQDCTDIEAKQLTDWFCAQAKIR